VFFILSGATAARADNSFDAVLTPPTMDPYGMVVVERAQTPQRFEFGVNAVFGYAHNPFNLTLTDPTTNSDQRYNLIQDQLTVDLGFFLGLWDFLSIAAVLPMGVNFYDDSAIGSPLIPQAPSAMNPTGFPGTSGLYNNMPRQNVEISQTGARDPRLAVKGRFYSGHHFEIGTILELTLPLGDSSSFLGEKNVTFRPRLLFGFFFSRLNLAFSFGGIVREGSQLYDPYTPTTLRFATGQELTWGAGVNVHAHRVVSLGIEGVGTIPVSGSATSPTATLLGSVSVRPMERWRIQLAGGGGLLPSSPMNADGRLILGFAYSFSPREGGLR
jgi:hypothetical protein